jgi:predicted DNA-binding protein
MTNQNDLYATDKPATNDSVVLAIRLPKEQREKFKALCESRNIDVSVVLRRFIERELKASQES